MFPYFGGKSHLLADIKANMPGSYRNYCELFGGSGKVSFMVAPVGLKIWNDIDTDLYDVFYCAKNHFRPFFDALLKIEFDRDAYHRMRESKPASQLDRAVKTYVLLAQARNGMKGASFRATKRTRRGMMETQSLWTTSLRRLLGYSRQLQHYKLFNTSYDSERFRQFDAKSTFWYLDPPYVPTTRASPIVYAHEFTTLDHVKLLRWVLTLEGSVMISGYECPLYRMMLPGWRIFELESYNRCAAGCGRKLAPSNERLYVNY